MGEVGWFFFYTVLNCDPYTGEDMQLNCLYTIMQTYTTTQNYTGLHTGTTWNQL